MSSFAVVRKLEILLFTPETPHTLNVTDNKNSIDMNHFSKVMSSKTEAELKAVVADNHTFVEDARQAALWELEKRNVKSGELVDVEQSLVQKNIDNSEKSKKPFFENKEKKYITDDPAAPEFYSKRAITIFSAIFSTIFGAVLLMSNFKSLGNKKGALGVLIFGIIYTTLVIIVGNQLKSNINFGLVFNFLGAFVLTEIFWNKQIGKEQKYRKKKIWKALIISICISIPLLLAAIYG